MQLQGYVAQLQEQLVVPAALGDEQARRIAEMLARAAGPAIQLAILEAVSDATEEITAALLDSPGAPSVAVRLDSGELRIDVRTTATEEAAPPTDEGELTARISLRLPEGLKSEIEAAARHANVSVNTWLNRAAASALASGERAATAAPGPGSHAVAGRRVTGWLNG